MKSFTTLQKLKPGDKVAVLSPASDMAGRFPWVQELGLKRLTDVFGLQPVEYASTRQLNVSIEVRAKDLMAAYADPEIKAVIASIGGQDQIKLIKHLDPEVFKNNPKAFFGFSDNTHFGSFLWNLGIPSYYGGCLMTQYGMQEKMHDYTVKYLKHAIFDTGEFEFTRSEMYNEITSDWADPKCLDIPRQMVKNEDWLWDGNEDVEGILWGGCLESHVVQSAASVFMPSDSDIDGTILFLESADGNTDWWVYEYILTGFGERGWLNRFKAILIGRPKSWEQDLQRTPEGIAKYVKDQQNIIIKTVREYNKNIPVIQNLDFGHTDPQAVLPKGQKARVVSSEKKIFLTY